MRCDAGCSLQRLYTFGTTAPALACQAWLLLPLATQSTDLHARVSVPHVALHGVMCTDGRRHLRFHARVLVLCARLS